MSFEVLNANPTNVEHMIPAAQAAIALHKSGVSEGSLGGIEYLRAEAPETLNAPKSVHKFEM